MGTQPQQPNNPDTFNPAIPVKKESFLHRHLLAELLAISLVAAAFAVSYYILAPYLVTDHWIPVHHSTSGTSTWKTYTDSEYGFKIMIPNSWEVHSVITPSSEAKDFITYILYAPTKDPNYFPDIKGYAAYINIEVYSLTDWQKLDKSHLTSLSKNDKFVFAYEILEHPELKDQITIDQILSTFKFTGPETVSVDSSAIIKNTENWALYSKTDIEVGTGDCGNAEFYTYLKKFNSGPKYMHSTMAIELMYTPNYYNWTNDKFLSYLPGSDYFCAVGGLYPLHAYADKLLWIGSCGGVLPEDPIGRKAVLTCEATANVINDYFAK